MITLVNKIPKINRLCAEMVKINCLFDSYKNDNHVMFWIQDDNKAVISMTDSNMIICNISAELKELKEFVDMLSPVCVFSDYDTLISLERKPNENINVMIRNCDIVGQTKGDILSSKELYYLLDVNGLSLPEYSYFAVDYCKRLNGGFADYFAIKDSCAVISFKTGDKAIINGISSHKKGFGSIALKAIIQKNYGKDLFVCCRDSVMEFYNKNGFKKLYNAGYWVKNK